MVSPHVIQREYKLGRNTVWAATLLLLIGLVSASLVLLSGRASAACSDPASPYGTLTLDNDSNPSTTTVVIPSAGDYRFWARIEAPDSTNNSFMMNIDGTYCQVKVGDNASMPTGSWQWVNYQNGSSANLLTFNMTAGAHQVKLFGTEAGVKVDRILFVTDTACTPTGTGDNCAADVQDPTVSISSPPNNSTVTTNTLQVTINASDDTALHSTQAVKYYLDGGLKKTFTASEGSPFQTTTDISGFANGSSHTVRAEAKDQAGNIKSVTHTFTVDRQTGGPCPSGNPPSAIVTIGAYNPANGTFYERNCNSTGPASTTVQFGNANWIPLSGDWNGDGVFTPGAYDPATATFYLRNTNNGGPADITFQYGNTGWIPLAGDWNGNGYWSVGLYNPITATFYLKDSNGGGSADYTFGFGNAGWKPIAGDWDRNGTTTVGVYNPSSAVYYLNDQNDASGAEKTIAYGNAGWTPIAGDWDGNGWWSIGAYDPATATFYLRNLNSTGGADLTFPFGGTGLKPIVGDWDGR